MKNTLIVPALLSADLARTAAFYTGLGFSIDRSVVEPDPPRNLALERDGFTLFFFSEPRGAVRTPTLSGTIYVFPDSVDALAREWTGRIAFSWGPELMPYGLYEFGLTDPDGYHIAFAERRAPVH
jgi:catechol 2,3-dioxygenase-like lactoylglutathione lyase family enzyme